MAIYNIPEPFREGFVELFKLDEEQIKELVEVIQSIPIGTGPKVFMDQINAKIQIDNIQQISRSIYSLGGLLVSQESETSENLVKDLAASFNYTYQSSLSKEDLSKLENKLKLIFSGSENLFLSVKSLNLLNENDKIYLESRIITDIRLVFKKEIVNQKRNAVLIHNLKLEFLQNTDRKEFYISLDHSDLKKLKEVIERALEKEKLIKNDYKDFTEFIELTD